MSKKIYPLLFYLLISFIFTGLSLAEIPVDPSGLGVQNGRLGARFNFDIQFGNPYYGNRQSEGVYTGVLGTEHDQFDQFVIASFLDADSSVQCFPFNSDEPYYPYDRVHMSLGLTHMKLTGVQRSKIAITFTQINPFTPTDSLNQQENLINTAPFFIQEVSIENLTDSLQTGWGLISHSDAQRVICDSLGHFGVLLLQGEDDNGGTRALAMCDTLDGWHYEVGDELFNHFHAAGTLKDTVVSHKAQGGFSWRFILGPNEKKTWFFIYAAYYDQTVMLDKRFNPPNPLKFAYTQYFQSVFDVLGWVINRKNEILNRTNEFESLLSQSLLSEDEKYTIAVAFHSYFPNTFLLTDDHGMDVRYYVWEGQIKYISTLDVAYDVGVFEGMEIPWALKRQLQEWDTIAQYDEDGVIYPHDLGYRLEITPEQAYDYLGGNMGVEENCDYLLLLYWYWKRTGDSAFLLSKRQGIQDILASLQRRDTNRDGIADRHAYFTTIDQKEAIHCAAENSYIAIKEMASYLASAEIFSALGDSVLADSFNNEAAIIQQTLVASPEMAGNADGRIPTIHYYGDNIQLQNVWEPYTQNDYCGPFPENWNTATMLIPEGLLYLTLSGYDFSSMANFIQKLMTSNKAHFQICHQGASYTSITSEKIRTWLSKLFDNELVNRSLSLLFPQFDHYELFALKEAFPLLSEKGNRGFSDAWEDSDGKRRGLDYYPRGVNSFAMLNLSTSDRLTLPVPLKINCGGDSVDGWQADEFQLGKRHFYMTSDSVQSAQNIPQYVLRTESYGLDETGYEIPLENGQYRVYLYFDEIYHTSSDHPGTRIFDVSIEDSIYIPRLDIFARVGADSLLREGPFEVNVNDGYLTILGVNHRGTDPNNKFNGIYVEHADRPNIFNLIVSNVGSYSAKIEWDTDVFTQGKVKYGPNDSLNYVSQVDTDFVFHHAIVLDSLFPSTRYFFKIVSWDERNTFSYSRIQSFITREDTTALSIGILHFEADMPTFGKVCLKWQMEFEKDCYGFEIQRSADGISFEKIGFVQAVGNDGKWFTYRYIDNRVKHYPVYYRIKAISIRGETYSHVLKINGKIPHRFSLGNNYPNPFAEKTCIPFWTPLKRQREIAKISIFNIKGQMVYQRKIGQLNQKNTFVWYGKDFSGHTLPAGVYFLVLKIKDRKWTKKLIFTP